MCGLNVLVSYIHQIFPSVINSQNESIHAICTAAAAIHEGATGRAFKFEARHGVGALAHTRHTTIKSPMRLCQSQT